MIKLVKTWWLTASEYTNLNKEMYKKFYIVLINNNSEEGCNIINKTGKNYYWGDFAIIIKNVIIKIWERVVTSFKV